MKKVLAICFLCIGLGFSYGIRPAFDLKFGWEFLKVEHVEGSHFLVLGIGMTAPFSRYIGLNASLFGLGIDLTESGTALGIGSRVGFIEMIPTKVASPYFRELIALDYLSSGGYSITDFRFIVGIGIEFLSNSYVSPYIGGDFGMDILSAGGGSVNTIDISAGLGVRFSWIK